MRTLDEVIKVVEEDLECANESYPEVFYDYDNHKDALHYLKEYREQKELNEHIYAEYKRRAEMYSDWKNEQALAELPLSWDELKMMEGKPVWVEADDGKYKGWVIVGKFYSLFENENLDAHVDLYYFGRSMEYSKEMYGYYWQAYRRERS